VASLWIRGHIHQGVVGRSGVVVRPSATGGWRARTVPGMASVPLGLGGPRASHGWKGLRLLAVRPFRAASVLYVGYAAFPPEVSRRPAGGRLRVGGAHGTEGGCRLRDRRRLSRPRGATDPGPSGLLRVRPPAEAGRCGASEVCPRARRTERGRFGEWGGGCLTIRTRCQSRLGQT
jgi:hypothetical protein